MVRQWSLPNYFALKTQPVLRRCFFLAAGNKKKFQRENATATAYDANEYPSTRRLVEDGMTTGLTNTLVACGFSDLYLVFARKQCILSLVLRHKCCPALLCHIDSRFFVPLEQSRTALLGCRLAVSRLREAAHIGNYKCLNFTIHFIMQCIGVFNSNLSKDCL